ncbi:PP2C family protein-serine/threonine phosphatase [Streptomyces sp. NPDC054834]
MSATEIDFAAVFAASPSPYLLLDTDLVIRCVNGAFLRVTGWPEGDLVGRYLFDAFPPKPEDSTDDGMRSVEESLRKVLASGQPDMLVLQRYDIPAHGRPGEFEERWWSPVHTPVLGPDGQVQWILQRAEDVTAFAGSAVRWRGTHLGGAEESVAAEVYARAQELTRWNEELRQSHSLEREVAVTLQEAMLRAPDLERHENIAVRYLPAVTSLNVCGDWYDVVDLSNGRFAVAVGDVVGHGLQAAAVMGMLRSALSAAIRAVPNPAQALEVLGLYARSFEDALAATAVKVLVDPRSHAIVYSNAGHPPPVLLHPDGSSELLDQATDPPLGARPEHLPRPQAILPYTRGDTLVLYTDGLIERRTEDIDAGLTRLTDALAQHAALLPDDLADALLTRLGVSTGGRDDIALVVIRL